MLRELVGGQFTNLGYINEIEYWTNLGGTGGTTVDCMVSYLNGQGYTTGTPKDRLAAWLQANQGLGHIGDNARKLVGYK